MNLLFKEGILQVNVPVQGETDAYLVKISFGGFLDILQDKVDKSNQIFDLRTITKTLTEGFNRDDVYIWCQCNDWHYRMGFWATVNQITSGNPENRPSKITNPNNTLGPGCKHVLLVLNNNGWLIKIASVIYNYVNWCKEHFEKGYADIIYPAIYNRPYEGEAQGSLFGDDELETDKETISTSSEAGRTRGQFKPENVQGIRFAPKEDEEEIKLDFED